MRGTLLDIVPEWGRLKLVLDKGRTTYLKTTYPFYLADDGWISSSLYSNPDVLKVERETWNSFEGKVNLLRVDSLNPWMKIRAKVFNSFPPSWAQAYVRMGLSPFHEVEISGSVATIGEAANISVAEVEVQWPISRRRVKVRINNEDATLDELEKTKVDVAIAPKWIRVNSEVRIDPTNLRIKLGIKGLIEWSIISKLPLREVESSSIGKILTTNEAWTAIKRKFIVPDARPNVERERTITEIREADKGGLIVFPVTGLYDDAIQIDFNSMYPNIIINYNISAETVNSKCNGREITTELGHTICANERGIVPESLEYLVKRKQEMKEVDKVRAEAIKWVLVASFGYLGYRNSRFGKIEAYELVTYLARKTMRIAIREAQEMGFEVIHGLIDSLVVRVDSSRIYSLIENIERKTKIGLKVDTEFDWICFTSSRKGESYPQRYFGRTPSGNLKVRGVIRKNQPKLVRDFLTDILNVASREANSHDAKRVVRESLPQITEEYLRRAYFGDPSDYVMEIKGIPYIKGKRLYKAWRYAGHDPLYYENFVKRAALELKGWFS
jgi:DNA polymerase I